jgi:hypothetical protein
MSTITWIIIVLIVISICVTVSEVAIRFAILDKGKSNSKLVSSHRDMAVDTVSNHSGMNLAKIRQGLSKEDVLSLCGIEFVDQTFAEI